MSGREVSYFRQKARELASRIESETKAVKSKDMWSKEKIVMIAAPILSFLLLLIWKPKFVTKENDDGERVRSLTKLVIWTVVLSAITIGSMYAYEYYSKKA